MFPRNDTTRAEMFYLVGIIAVGTLVILFLGLVI